jgi:hypothetical protein
MGLKETKYGKTQNSKGKIRETKDELSLISRDDLTRIKKPNTLKRPLELILIYKRAKKSQL